MKRFLTAIFAGAIVFGLVAAFAASLTVNSGGLGAGSNAVPIASCDPSVDVGYTTVWNDTVGRYDLTGVTVRDIAASCNSVGVHVGTEDLGSQIPAAGEASFTLTTPVSAELFVGDVHVVVSS